MWIWCKQKDFCLEFLVVVLFTFFYTSFRSSFNNTILLEKKQTSAQNINTLTLALSVGGFFFLFHSLSKVWMGKCISWRLTRWTNTHVFANGFDDNDISCHLNSFSFVDPIWSLQFLQLLENSMKTTKVVVALDGCQTSGSCNLSTGWMVGWLEIKKNGEKSCMNVKRTNCELFTKSAHQLSDFDCDFFSIFNSNSDSDSNPLQANWNVALSMSDWFILWLNVQCQCFSAISNDSIFGKKRNVFQFDSNWMWWLQFSRWLQKFSFIYFEGCSCLCWFSSKMIIDIVDLINLVTTICNAIHNIC